MIKIEWTHESADPRAFAPLLPKAIEAIERWARVDGKMQTDEFGPYYDVITTAPGFVRHQVLRPATLRLGAQKALQDAPYLWSGWHGELELIFRLIGSRSVSRPEMWPKSNLDLMVQLAWFRTVVFQ